MHPHIVLGAKESEHNFGPLLFLFNRRAKEVRFINEPFYCFNDGSIV